MVKGKKWIALALSIIMLLTLTVSAFAAQVTVDNAAQFGAKNSALTIKADGLTSKGQVQVFMEYGTPAYSCKGPVTLYGGPAITQWDVYTVKSGVLGYEPDKNLKTGGLGDPLEYTITQPGTYLVRGWFADFPVRNNVVLFVEKGSSAGAVKSFRDVASSRWSHEAIMLCAKHGAVGGTKGPDANGVATFDPTGTVTLGQFLTVLTRLVAADEIGASNAGENWAAVYYRAAVSSGLIDEVDFSLSDLNDEISREDMCFLLVRAAQLNGETLEIRDGVAAEIQDYDSIAMLRQDDVLRAYSAGLITGYSGGVFDPKGTMTREEMATVVCRLMNYMPRAAASAA